MSTVLSVLRFVRGSLLCAFGALGCGLGGYNSYATPRTTTPGKYQAALFVQGVGFTGEVGGTVRRAIVPTAPSYALRRGFLPNLDLGARVGLALVTLESGIEKGGTQFEVATDVRWRFVEGEAIEVAFGPGIRYAIFTDALVSENGWEREKHLGFWTFDAPVITGINLSKTLGLVLSTGVVYDVRTPNTEPYRAAIAGRWNKGFAPRVAIGLHSDSGRFGVHPELSLVFSTREREQRVIYTLGVAIEVR